MTRFYPECDSYECEVCPRREDCDIREEDEEEDGIYEIRPYADPLADLERRILAMKADIAELRVEVKRLMRNESELMAGLGRWVGQVEGGDYD